MGISNDSSNVDVRIIASSKNWIDGEAVQQLENTAKLPGIVKAVGMPDLHAGKGYPVGVAFLSKHRLYPALVGNDIGCGMGLWQTGLKASKLKIEKWASNLNIDAPWDGDVPQWLEAFGLPHDLFPTSLGTIGGGNHFAELQRVEDIVDLAACRSIGLDKSDLYLLVHSGSRGLGQLILSEHIERYAHGGLDENSEDTAAYLCAHNQAVRWGKANRALIAHRFTMALRGDEADLFDLPHNSVVAKDVNGVGHWLHRKGASPSDGGFLVIPGSRGSFSYVVEPIGDQRENAFSLAHGAGRKWKRSDARARLSKRFKQQDFVKTDLGSRVVCEDKGLIYEEAPQAYKNIDVVIQDMVAIGIIRVLAVLRPVLTYKTKR